MSYASEVLTDSPAAYWKFNEPSGTTITDYGSVGISLTLTNGPTLGVAGPVMGDTACNFVAASNQYAIGASASAGYQTGDTFSLECWFKRTVNQSAFMGLVALAGGGIGNFKIGLYTDNTLDLTKLSVATVAQSSTAYTDTTTWHHFIATKTGATRKIYVDGVDVTASLPTNSTFGAITNQMIVGAKTTGGEWFDGFMAHVAVYTTPLSAARIAAHYNAAFSGLTTQVAQYATTAGGRSR